MTEFYSYEKLFWIKIILFSDSYHQSILKYFKYDYSKFKRFEARKNLEILLHIDISLKKKKFYIVFGGILFFSTRQELDVLSSWCQKKHGKRHAKGPENETFTADKVL